MFLCSYKPVIFVIKVGQYSFLNQNKCSKSIIILQWSISIWMSAALLKGPVESLSLHIIKKDFMDLPNSKVIGWPDFAKTLLLTKITMLWVSKWECLVTDILFCIVIYVFDWQTSERILHVAAVMINNVILKLDLFIMGLIHFSLNKARVNQLTQLCEQNITLFWSKREAVELYNRPTRS